MEPLQFSSGSMISDGLKSSERNSIDALNQTVRNIKEDANEI